MGVRQSASLVGLTDNHLVRVHSQVLKHVVRDVGSAQVEFKGFQTGKKIEVHRVPGIFLPIESSVPCTPQFKVLCIQGTGSTR
mmetsp:Transcript_56148/g.99942  ORF Transcript_56148/g.99942 Transcript_56148/m.99942 type:complete len:83 (-) Transcript_56148:820-1068(-)